MWRYVNSGYGELLNKKLGTIKSKTYGPIAIDNLANTSVSFNAKKV